MKSLVVAARFAAFTWYTNVRQGRKRIIENEARRFARKNWTAFLSLADEGLGELLRRIAKSRVSARRRSKKANRPMCELTEAG